MPTGVDTLSKIIAGAAVVFCNSRAAARIGASPERRLLAMGARAVVLTVGGDGAMLVDRDERRVAVSAPRVSAGDTTGAGDCLAGWFVAERLRALPPSALRTAVVAATMA